MNCNVLRGNFTNCQEQLMPTKNISATVVFNRYFVHLLYCMAQSLLLAG